MVKLAFAPLPGSLAARAIAYLEKNGKTAASPLADACGCDIVDVRIALAPAIKAEAVMTTRFNGLQWFAPVIRLSAEQLVGRMDKPRLRIGSSGNWLCVVFRKRGRGKIASGPVGVGETPVEAFVEWKALADLERQQQVAS